MRGIAELEYLNGTVRARVSILTQTILMITKRRFHQLTLSEFCLLVFNVNFVLKTMFRKKTRNERKMHVSPCSLRYSFSCFSDLAVYF